MKLAVLTAAANTLVPLGECFVLLGRHGDELVFLGKVEGASMVEREDRAPVQAHHAQRRGFRA